MPRRDGNGSITFWANFKTKEEAETFKTEVLKKFPYWNGCGQILNLADISTEGHEDES